MAQPELSDNLIEQFGRQILVPGIDEQGQLNLSKRKICIIGLGALGTVASQYLVRSGIGEVHLIDPDQIEESNLHRQINYTLEDVGAFKSEVSKNKLQRINDITKITSHQTTYKNYLKEHTNENFDLVFDCTDNHENKILSSQLCKKNKIAYASVSINSTEGIYFSQNYKKTISIIDRKQAIKTACKLAQEGDIILVAGKGHETYQIIGDQKTGFDDFEITNQILTELNK